MNGLPMCKLDDTMSVVAQQRNEARALLLAEYFA